MSRYAVAKVVRRWPRPVYFILVSLVMSSTKQPLHMIVHDSDIPTNHASIVKSYDNTEYIFRKRYTHTIILY